MRKYGEKILGVTLVSIILVLCMSISASAASYSKDGVMMSYYLSQIGNQWRAETYCYEDMSSMTSLFLYNRKGGTLLKSSCVKGNERVVVSGSSVTRTQAIVYFFNSSAKYGRSSHALLWSGTNVPYISSLSLEKSK